MTHFFFEAANPASKCSANFRQFSGAKDDENDSKYQKKFTSTKSKHDGLPRLKLHFWLIRLRQLH